MGGIGLIRTCEPAVLLFPLHFQKQSHQWKGLVLKRSPNQNCYMEFDNQDYYPDWFAFNWNPLRNLMVFTLFSTHILGKNTIRRFYTQAVVNLCLLAVLMGKLLLF